MLGKILATEDVAGVSPLILWAVQGERRGAGAQLAPRRNAHAKHRRMRRGRRGRVRAVQDVATSRGGGGRVQCAAPYAAAVNATAATTRVAATELTSAGGPCSWRGRREGACGDSGGCPVAGSVLSRRPPRAAPPPHAHVAAAPAQ